MSALQRFLTTPLKSGWNTVRVATDGYLVATVNSGMNDPTEYARIFAASVAMLKSLHEAADCLQGTLNARGYAAGSSTDGWSAEVREEVRTLAALRATIAKVEGRANGRETAKGDPPPTARCEQDILRYDAELDRLELAPNGDDYNNVMSMVRGGEYQAPHSEGR